MAPTATTSPSRPSSGTRAPRPSGAPVPGGALDLVAAAHRDLAAARGAAVPAERYAAAHRGALHAAAAVLAVRARPDGRRRVRSAWDLLAGVAPEMQEWAAFFAAGAAKRAAAEAGLRRSVSERDADDLLRDGAAFLAVVEDALGVPRPLPGA
ncbi:hypothetical protein EV189_3333 [Motilibacter rhizosphaerae]|uniref:SAV-6107-like HEPN domain-containing protein n=1 Tax=Motilibacter rhizosphaerae TaxID=598652 RepID=A0A4Q7NGI0_9ACTN|nr:SAV_6107 family HEPN domain-containing protein [Motilibacter rhizosphaerae]RZS82935.1 hypothetical protein EV189_3333 [Motilibacter rhizosphaerae]